MKIDTILLHYFIINSQLSTMNSVTYLYSIYYKGGSLTPSVLNDLFGFMNLPESIASDEGEFTKRVQLMDGLYKGLYLMDIPAREIEKNRRENTLDNLIHEKYAKHSSGYYTKFCEQGVPIGKTYMK